MATMASIGNYLVHEPNVPLTSGQIQGIIHFLGPEYGPYPGGSTGVGVGGVGASVASSAIG